MVKINCLAIEDIKCGQVCIFDPKTGQIQVDKTNGFTLMVDENVPKGEVQFVYKGKVIGRVTNGQ